MSDIVCRTVKRYYVDGKGFANLKSAARAIAKAELRAPALAYVREREKAWAFLNDHGMYETPGVTKEQTDKWWQEGFALAFPPNHECRCCTSQSICHTCNGTGTHPYGDVCRCDGGYLGSDELHGLCKSAYRKALDERIAAIAAEFQRSA